MHVKGFWDHKAKIPFVEGYNDAISGTAEVVRVLGLSRSLWATEIVSLDPVVYVLRLSIRNWPIRRLDLFGVSKVYARAITS